MSTLGPGLSDCGCVRSTVGVADLRGFFFPAGIFGVSMILCLA